MPLTPWIFVVVGLALWLLCWFVGGTVGMHLVAVVLMFGGAGLRYVKPGAWKQ
jgi:hypothetical protein